MVIILGIRQIEEKQDGQGKGKGEPVKERKRPLSEGTSMTGKAQCWEGVGGAGVGGGAVKKGGTKCLHNRERSKCK